MEQPLATATGGSGAVSFGGIGGSAILQLLARMLRSATAIATGGNAGRIRSKGLCGHMLTLAQRMEASAVAIANGGNGRHPFWILVLEDSKRNGDFDCDARWHRKCDCNSDRRNRMVFRQYSVISTESWHRKCQFVRHNNKRQSGPSVNQLPLGQAARHKQMHRRFLAARTRFRLSQRARLAGQQLPHLRKLVVASFFPTLSIRGRAFPS